MKINREWAMPNSKTFKVKPIKELIKRYVKNSDLVIDPFANEYSIKNEIICKKYISNDIDTSFDTDYHLEAQEFMKLFDDNSVDVILFDPPYSSRQISECYKKLNKTVTMNDTNSGYFTKFKKQRCINHFLVFLCIKSPKAAALATTQTGDRERKIITATAKIKISH